jgi:hypothetical protein
MPMALNGLSYTLAESGQELELAERAAWRRCSC